MADIPAANWDETDNNNDDAAPDGFPEGMAPNGVNNGARAIMGAVKRWWNRANAVKTTGGTSSAYTLTYGVTPGAYYDGEIISFVVNAANAAAATLNVNALGAIPLRKFSGSAFATLAAGDVQANQIVQARYNSLAGTFDIIALSGGFTLAKTLAATGYQTLPGGLLMQWGSVAVLASNTAAVSFSIAFSAAPYSVHLTEKNNNTQPGSVTSPSTTGFSAGNPGSSGTNYYWLAIGPA